MKTSESSEVGRGRLHFLKKNGGENRAVSLRQVQRLSDGEALSPLGSKYEDRGVEK